MPCQENTSSALQTLKSGELRGRVVTLRRELQATTKLYQTARTKGNHTEVMILLRKRTQLVRDLFQTQSELLLVFRTGRQENHASA